MVAIEHAIQIMFLTLYIGLIAAAFALCLALTIHLFKQIKNMKNSEYEQLMNERQQRLEQAIIEAQKGNGTDEDWAIICSECGVPPLHKLIGKQNVNSESRI